MTKYFTLPNSILKKRLLKDGEVCDLEFREPMSEVLVQSVGASLLSKRSKGVFSIDASDTQKDALEAITGAVLYENRLYDLSDLFPLELVQNVVDAEPTPGLNKFSFVVVAPDGQPIPAVSLTCRIDRRDGPVYTSDHEGRVTVEMACASIPALVIQPVENFWPTVIYGRAPSEQPEQIILSPVELDKCERFVELLGESDVNDGKGVVIAVIDTGVAAHTNLPNVTKRLTVLNAEPVIDELPNGIAHGTHVAGIIGSNHPECLGKAPSAELHSYRVCAPNSRNMETLDVVSAITEAVESGADIINLSLGFDDEDAAIVDAVEFALMSGVVVIAASGNKGLDSASFPARMKNVVSVSAIGKVDAYPHGSQAALTRAKEQVGEYFVGSFCNTGDGQIQCSAPGIGIVSTVGMDGFLPCSGTSMAAPIISGLGAAILSRHIESLGARSVERAQKLMAMLYTTCKSHGLTPANVGLGIPSVR